MFNPIDFTAVARHISPERANKVLERHQGDRSNRTGAEFEENYAIERLIKILASEKRSGGDGSQSYARAGQVTLVDDLHIFHAGVHTYSQLKSGNYHRDWIAGDVIRSFKDQQTVADELWKITGDQPHVKLELVVRDEEVLQKFKKRSERRFYIDIKTHHVFPIVGVPDHLRADLKEISVYPYDDRELELLLELIASAWRLHRQVGYFSDFIKYVARRSRGGLLDFGAEFVLTQEVKAVFEKIRLNYKIEGNSLKVFESPRGELMHEVTCGTREWYNFEQSINSDDSIGVIVAALMDLE